MRHLIMIAMLLFIGCSAPKVVLLDDFEGQISKETADFGSGNGSKVNVAPSLKTIYSGHQALEVDYNSVKGGYMWIARGYNLDVPGAGQWVKKPQQIDWKQYSGVSFYFYGEGNGAQIAFDVKDAQKEILRYMFTDDTKGWRKISCPFSKFVSRTDWQPQGVPVNKTIDYPVMSFQFEVKSPGEGSFCVDKVEVYK